ncbi:MAG: CBS domain-containing protein [Gammaproteobacteria bacterium]|jgi:CBS domain-containing protein|nr:CBS domain-containing protein [Gammaproteobacteria bacterium]
MRRHIVPDVVNDQEIAALSKSATVRDAARLMRERSISAVLVMEGDALEGIFTVRDVARRIVAADLSLDTMLGDVMTPNPETITSAEIPLRGLRRMHDGGFRHLPVVDGTRVVGVVSRRDFFREDEEMLGQETSLWEHLR